MGKLVEAVIDAWLEIYDYVIRILYNLIPRPLVSVGGKKGCMTKY